MTTAWASAASYLMGWFEAMPGLFPGTHLVSPPDARPGTVLIQRLEAGATLDQVAEEWGPRLGLEEAPMTSTAWTTVYASRPDAGLSAKPVL